MSLGLSSLPVALATTCGTWPTGVSPSSRNRLITCVYPDCARQPDEVQLSQRTRIQGIGVQFPTEILPCQLLLLLGVGPAHTPLSTHKMTALGKASTFLIYHPPLVILHTGLLPAVYLSVSPESQSIVVHCNATLHSTKGRNKPDKRKEPIPRENTQGPTEQPTEDKKKRQGNRTNREANIESLLSHRYSFRCHLAHALLSPALQHQSTISQCQRFNCSRLLSQQQGSRAMRCRWWGVVDTKNKRVPATLVT